MNNKKSMLSLMMALIAIIILFTAQLLIPTAKAVVNNDGDDDDGAIGILVDNDRAQCPSAQFTSIQAAVTAAQAGAVISVCPGTYPETVRINKPLTIRGIRVGNENLVVINPPIAAANTTSLFSGAPIAAIVLVEHGATNVTLDNLTVDGAANTFTTCSPDFVGIFYRNGSGKINNVSVKNIRYFPDTLLGCQSGLGIFAQSGDEPGVHRGARVEVFNSSIHDYQKNGITGNEHGTELRVVGNAVSGLGPTPAIAQNGVQIGFGARGRIVKNSIINHIFSLCTTQSNCSFTASSILIVSAVSGIQVLENNLGKSQVNIFFGGDSDAQGNPQFITNGLIEDNTVFDSDVFDGIAIVNGNHNTVRDNSIYNSDRAAVSVQGVGNRIVGNNFNEAPIGVLRTMIGDNTITGNHYFNIAQRVVTQATIGSNSIERSTALSASRTVSATRP